MYFYVTCGADEETQKRGFISLHFKISEIKYKKSAANPFAGCSCLHRVVCDLPVRVEAHHKFLESNPKDTVMQKLVDYAIEVMNPEIRARMGVYYGTYCAIVHATPLLFSLAYERTLVVCSLSLPQGNTKIG